MEVQGIEDPEAGVLDNCKLLDMKLESLERALRALNHQDISLAPVLVLKSQES